MSAKPSAPIPTPYRRHTGCTGNQASAIQANVSDLSFQPHQGALAAAGSIDVVSQGNTTRHVVGMLGRVRNCSPEDGFDQLAHHSNCPPSNAGEPG